MESVNDVVKGVCLLSSKATQLSDDFSEAFAIFTEIIPEAHALKALYHWTEVTRVKHFLRGLEVGQITGDKWRKLSDYCNNIGKAEYIANTLRRICNSQSNTASCLLGLMASNAIKGDRILSMFEWKISFALENICDLDLSCFKKVVSSALNMNSDTIQEDMIRSCATSLELDVKCCKNVRYSLACCLGCLHNRSPEDLV